MQGERHLGISDSPHDYALDRIEIFEGRTGDATVISHACSIIQLLKIHVAQYNFCQFSDPDL
jgi:hypothetical protein